MRQRANQPIPGMQRPAARKCERTRKHFRPRSFLCGARNELFCAFLAFTLDQGECRLVCFSVGTRSSLAQEPCLSLYFCSHVVGVQTGGPEVSGCRDPAGPFPGCREIAE